MMEEDGDVEERDEPAKEVDDNCKKERVKQAESGNLEGQSRKTDAGMERIGKAKVEEKMAESRSWTGHSRTADAEERMQWDGEDLMNLARPRVSQGAARRERRKLGIAKAFNQHVCDNPDCQKDEDHQDNARLPQSDDVLAALATIEPSTLNSVVNGWEMVEFTVDSGASETVVSDEMLSSVETRESPASRRGWSTRWRTASGSRTWARRSSGPKPRTVPRRS